MHEIGWHYERARLRIDGLLRTAAPDVWATPVAACPGWTVHDVVAHLVGNTEDGAAGRLNGPPTEAQTQDQIDRHRDDDPVAMLDFWAESGPFVAAAVTESGMWPAAIDVVTHEHDLRAALNRPGSRDDPSIIELADLLASGIGGPTAIEVDFGGSAASQARGDGDGLCLRTTPFELVRLRLGRRSRRQVEALDWSADPTDVLPHLFVFGPAPVDIIE